MTLVLSVHNRDTLWVVVDRRLSYGDRRPPIDDAVKIMDLDTIDGRGLLAYAGLGATANGSQPSDWMSAVLRGRKGLTFEQSLSVLSKAATRELPNHLAQIRTPSSIMEHTVIIPAFVRNIGYRLYSIANVVNRTTDQHWYRCTRHEIPQNQGSRSPRIGLGGTGGHYLNKRAKTWQRDLLRLVNAHGRGKVTDYMVADRLAALNHDAHLGVDDGSVGPRCIVIWRGRPDARRAVGAAHAMYTGVIRDQDVAAVPTIANGMDVRALVTVHMNHILQRLADGHSTSSVLDIDQDDVTRQLAQLRWTPDERLR